ncbi:efflux pump antibiotic resistance protein [Viridothelium virens]|uniref:Efflux pump antibiotic resistance protein n=1 Tax=Viridothelium virens TaxID=1048519 RepID=A0A6A6HFD9_VIRVR|nr:efflux pump antibiotic resistance protein [Viridothelium virens]
MPSVSHETSFEHPEGDDHGPNQESFTIVEDTPAPPEIQYPTGFKFAMICLSVALAVTLTGLDLNIVATAVPKITDDFHTITDIGWYTAAYRLTMCAFQFMFGKMYAVFSIKWVYLSALLIFEIGSVVNATASTSAVFVLGRAISGFGCAGIVAGAFTMITLSLPLRRRPVFSGAAAMIEEIASVCSPVLGGLITDKISWRWCFYINLPLGAATMAIIMLFFENPQIPYAPANDPTRLSFKEKIRKLDLLGTLIFVPGTTSLLLALQFGTSRYGWADARVITCFILFATLFAIFAYWQYRRGDEATLPPRIIGNKNIMSGMWFSLCNSSTYSIIQYYMPIYFQAIRGLSASRSGILILPSIIGLMIALPVAGSATSIIGYFTPFMLLTSLLTPIAAGLITTLKVSMPLANLLIYQALLGVGAGIGWQGPQVAAQSVFQESDIPLSIASILFAQNFGPAFSIPIAQAIFQNRLVSDIEKYTPGSGINAASLQSMGLSDLRRAVGAKELASVLFGYDKAISQTFYLPVGLACATLIGSAGMEWRSVKKTN